MRRAPSSFPESLLTPISIDVLRRLLPYRVDLYLQATQNRSRMLFTAADASPSAGDLDRLRQAGVEQLFMRIDQIDELHASLEALLASGLDLLNVERIAIAKELAKAGFAEVWRCSSTAPLIAAATKLSDDLMQACACGGDMTTLLISLIRHDNSTFVHITNVCTYSILLAERLGITSQSELREIGVGALLHDLGKRRVAPDILQKPGALSSRERKEIQLHPTRGFEELCHNAEMTLGQLMMVYQHHERPNGSGYPVRAVAADIHWMAGLCSVVDVFDALTSHRSYRTPATAEQALDFLTKRAGTEFDRDMVDCWRHLLRESKEVHA